MPCGMEHSSEKNREEIWKEGKEYREGPEFLYLSHLSLACREKNKSGFFNHHLKKRYGMDAFRKLRCRSAELAELLPASFKSAFSYLHLISEPVALTCGSAMLGKPASPQQRGEYSVHAKFLRAIWKEVMVAASWRSCVSVVPLRLRLREGFAGGNASRLV